MSYKMLLKEKQEKAYRPTEKQLGYAEKLSKQIGIPVPEEAKRNRKKMSQFIGYCKAEVEKRKAEKEVKEEAEEKSSEFAYEVCDRPIEYQNIELPIVCFIPLKYIRENKELYRRKKGSSGYSLYAELISFLKDAKAKVQKGLIKIESSVRYPPHVLLTILDAYCLEYKWNYKTV